MGRYEELNDILNQKRFFKLVCGAGNEDAEAVKRLAVIYTIAGANMLDLSANADVVKAAKDGIELAGEIGKRIGKKIKAKPFLNVSIGLKGDPHAQKAVIDLNNCTQCGKCIDVCPEDAITREYKVIGYKCIGCDDCEEVCEFDAVSFVHKKADFEKILPDCIKEGVETMELHAVTEDDAAVFADWKLLNKLMKDNFLSMCIDRQLLSNRSFIDRVRRAYEITGDRLIIQADGVPMSGGENDFNTTLQAVACADIVQKSGIPVKILLSGGTNGKTGLLAKQCGIMANGVAIGSWARKIVKEFIRRDDFYSDPEVIRKAVSVAEELVKSNVEAISG
jgi:Fe-S-cluster-containing hydrogenase component 2